MNESQGSEDNREVDGYLENFMNGNLDAVEGEIPSAKRSRISSPLDDISNQELVYDLDSDTASTTQIQMNDTDSKENLQHINNNVDTVADKNDFESKVLAFLRQNWTSKLVFAHYKIHKTLNKETRALLTRCIVGKFKDDALQTLEGDEQLESFVISREVFTALSALIQKTFPGESASTYYSPYRGSENGTTLHTSGSLWAHYNYMKEYLRHKGVLNPPKSKTRFAFVSYIDSYDVIVDEKALNVALNNLKNSLSTGTLLEDWMMSFNHRCVLLKIEKITVADYLKQFPCLKTEDAKKLFEHDFERIKPGRSELFQIRWPFIKRVLISQLLELENKAGNRKNKLSIDDRVLIKNLSKLEEDINVERNKKDAVVLHLLQSLISVGSPGRKKKGDPPTEIVKYTPLEIRNTFIYYVKEIGDLEAEILSLRKQFIDKKDTLQPVVFVVGENLENINEAYVVVDDQQYKVSTCLDALDFTFKIFYALDCSYPKASLRLCQFIQAAGYEIPISETIIKSLKELLGLTKRAFETSGLLEIFPNQT